MTGVAGVIGRGAVLMFFGAVDICGAGVISDGLGIPVFIPLAVLNIGCCGGAVTGAGVIGATVGRGVMATVDCATVDIKGLAGSRGFGVIFGATLM